MRTRELNNLIKTNIDKLRILQDGYFICYYIEDKKIMYSIKAKLKSKETYRYLAILWGPISSDYVDEFVEQLLRDGKYNNFIEAVDPFMYLWYNGLLYKTRNPKVNFFKSDNEYTLICQKNNHRYFSCFC